MANQHCSLVYPSNVAVTDILLASLGRRARLRDDAFARELPEPEFIDRVRREYSNSDKVKFLISLIYYKFYPTLVKDDQKINKPRTSTGFERLLQGHPVQQNTKSDFEAIVSKLEPKALGAAVWDEPTRKDTGDPNDLLRDYVLNCQRAIENCDLHKASALIDRIGRIIDRPRRGGDINISRRIEALMQISEFYIYHDDLKRESDYAEKAKELALNQSKITSALHIDVISRHLFSVFHRDGGDAFFELYGRLNAKYDFNLSKPAAASWRILAQHVKNGKPENSLDHAPRILSDGQIPHFVSWQKVASALCALDESALMDALLNRAAVLNIQGREECLKSHRMTLHVASLWLRALNMKNVHGFAIDIRGRFIKQLLA